MADKYLNTDILAWQTTINQSQGAGVEESLTTQRPSSTLVTKLARGRRRRRLMRRRRRRRLMRRRRRERQRIRRRFCTHRGHKLKQNSKLPYVVA